MKDFKRIILLNSESQNDVIAWYCLEHSEIGRFKQLLADGMPLNAFMLNAMVFLGYSNATIKEVLKTNTNRKKEVVDWMNLYFDITEIEDILPLYEDLFWDEYPTDEDCIRLKLWNTLHKRKRNDVIAKLAPEVAQKLGLYEELLKADFEKYAPICLKEKRLHAIMSVKDGWKYLIDNGQADWVLKLGDYCGLLSKAEIAEYCLQQGLYDELYKAKYYDELLAHGEVDVFVKNHSFHSDFLTKYPEKVNWEEWWKECSDDMIREYLKCKARVNKKLPQCNEFLMAHTGIWGQIGLLIG